MSTCVSYYRISTSDQKSIPSQKEELTLLAQKNNWGVLKEYSEIGSGKTIKDRPAIQELISDLPRLSPDYLLVVDQDRLSRGDDFWLMKSILRESGVKIATLQQVIDLEKEDEDLTSDLFAIVAKFERNKIIARAKRGIRKKIMDGYHNGEAPFGYKKTNGELIINPVESKIVSMIFEKYSSGKSIRVITSYLNENKIKSGRGNEFDISTVWRMLHNKTYAGYVRCRDNWYGGRHEAIITPENFEGVSLLLKNNFNGVRGYNYFLRGLLYCGKCGMRMTTGQHRKIPHYCCGQKRTKKCSGVSANKKNVDEVVLQKLAQEIDYLKKIILPPEGKKGQEVNDNSKEIKGLEKNLRRLETDYYVQNKLPKESFENLRDNILSKIMGLKNQPKKVEFDYSILKDIEGKWFMKNASLENKRVLACQLIEKITVLPATSTRQSIAKRLRIEWIEDV